MSMDITQTPSGFRGRWIAFVLIAVAAIVIGVIAVPRLLNRAPAKPVVSAADTTPVVAVEVGKVGDLQVTEEAMQLAEIKIGRSEAKQVSEKLTVSGNVEPGGDRTAKLTPRVKGKVTAIFAVAGDEVRAGQTLAMIESSELAKAQTDFRQAGLRVTAARQNLDRQKKLAGLGAFSQPKVQDARRASITSQGDSRTSESEVMGARAEIREAESDVAALQSALSQAQTQVKVAESRFNRADLLVKEQLIARQEWEQSQADLERAKADVNAARARISQGESKVETAKAKLNTALAKLDAAHQRQEIETQALKREEAVFKGRYTTTKEIVEAEAALRQAQIERESAAQAVTLLGGMVGGGNTVPLVSPLAGRVQDRSVTLGETVDTEHPLFTIMNLDVVWAQLAVAPSDLPNVRLGQRLDLTAETAPGRVFSGTVSSIGSSTDDATRMVRVRTAIENAGGALRPGAFVRGSLVTDMRKQRVTVPEDAIQDHSGKMTVYVAKGVPGAFEVRHVKLGVRGDGWREITRGLEGGEKIAVTGTFYLKSEALKSALSDGCCAPAAGK
jgi:RND family efflux transporter MFP subunit